MEKRHLKLKICLCPQLPEVRERRLQRVAHELREVGTSVTKILTLPAKSFSRQAKMRRCRSKFTLCLPGSPKVNAGGVCALGCRGVGCSCNSCIQRSQSKEIGASSCGEGPNLDPGMFEPPAPVSQYLRAQRLTSSSNGWWGTSRPVTAIVEATDRSDGRRHRRRRGHARAAAAFIATRQITP
jgi:hypothetical protein